MSIQMQIIWLFLLSIPIACVAWTVTHEELFKELRDYCVKRSLQGKTRIERKFFTFLLVSIVSVTTLSFCFCF